MADSGKCRYLISVKSLTGWWSSLYLAPSSFPSLADTLDGLGIAKQAWVGGEYPTTGKCFLHSRCHREHHLIKILPEACSSRGCHCRFWGCKSERLHPKINFSGQMGLVTLDSNLSRRRKTDSKPWCVKTLVSPGGQPSKGRKTLTKKTNRPSRLRRWTEGYNPLL